MTMWRVFFIKNDKKIYQCEQPGIWAHWCEDAEYCVPFTQEQAIDAVKWNEKHCGDVEGLCYIEMYDETRALSINDKGIYRPSSYTHLLNGTWKKVQQEKL